MLCYKSVIVNSVHTGDNKDDGKSEMRKRSLRKCNVKKKEKLGQVIEEAKRNLSAKKKQRLCGYIKLRKKNVRKKNTVRTECEKLYTLLRRKSTNVKNNIEHRKTFGKKYRGADKSLARQGRKQATAAKP